MSEPAPAEDEVKSSYEETPHFKQLFWNFDQDVLHLKWVPTSYNQKVRDAFDGYITSVDALSAAFTKKNCTQGEIEDRDLLRSAAHTKTATVLVEKGLVPNQMVGRIVVRAFLVDLGLDCISQARRADVRREGEEVVDVPRFSAERSRSIQDHCFSICPQLEQADYCRAGQYINRDAKNYLTENRSLDGD